MLPEICQILDHDDHNIDLHLLMTFISQTPYVLITHNPLWVFLTKDTTLYLGHFKLQTRHGLTFWPIMAHFHHFSICNQNQSISILVIFRQNTKVIALLFGQKWLIFITFQSAIKINQFQFWSFFGKIPRL